MTSNYVTGKQFIEEVDKLNQYLDKRANTHLMFIIHAELQALGDGLRHELHDRLEKVVKATEEERMMSMHDLESRITKAIAENTRRDKIRFRWVMGSATITIVNLAALVTLYFKMKGI